MKVCINCGARQDDTMIFCNQCKESLGDPISEEEKELIEKQIQKKLEKSYKKLNYILLSKILLIIYTGLPLIICSIHAMSIHYTVRTGGFIDLSDIVIAIVQIFWGIVLLVANLIIFIKLKFKKTLNRTWTHQISYFIAYILVCIVSNYNIMSMTGRYSVLSFNLSCLMPFIIIIFIVIFNLLIKLKIDKDTFDVNIPLIISIILIIALIVSVIFYYTELNDVRNWRIIYWNYPI